MDPHFSNIKNNLCYPFFYPPIFEDNPNLKTFATHLLGAFPCPLPWVFPPFWASPDCSLIFQSGVPEKPSWPPIAQPNCSYIVFLGSKNFEPCRCVPNKNTFVYHAAHEHSRCEILEIDKQKLAHLYHWSPQMRTKHPHIFSMFPYVSYKAVYHPPTKKMFPRQAVQSHSCRLEQRPNSNFKAVWICFDIQTNMIPLQADNEWLWFNMGRHLPVYIYIYTYATVHLCVAFQSISGVHWRRMNEYTMRSRIFVYVPNSWWLI